MHWATIDELNAEHYKMIEEMAGTGFSLKEIAEVMQVEVDVFTNEFNNKSSMVYMKYRKGFLESELKLRQRIFKDANNGSSPAQTLAKKIMDEAQFKTGDL